MNELLTKLSSYNLFNYLLPGVLFAILASETTPHQFIQKDIITGVFFYYFLGLVVSRFGSLVIGPILKSLSFVKFADYKAFVAASKKDPQIEILFRGQQHLQDSMLLVQSAANAEALRKDRGETSLSPGMGRDAPHSVAVRHVPVCIQETDFVHSKED
jgi:hypothetical protein